MQIANITDPRYLEDVPKEDEVFECGLCNDKFDHELDLWETTCGQVLVCPYCYDYNSKEDTHILIELIKCAK